MDVDHGETAEFHGKPREMCHLDANAPLSTL